MKVLVTGSNGFIGKNVIVRLSELGFEALTFTRDSAVESLPKLVKQVDFIIHLAGENRPLDDRLFEDVNVGLTELICQSVRSSGKKIPIIFASSTQACLNNTYGRSKFDAELVIKKLGKDTGSSVFIFRLPGVFGKWCKPNYNSVVATFCHNTIYNLPLQLSDPLFEITLVYIDDLLNAFLSILTTDGHKENDLFVQPEYRVTIGELADQIRSFYDSRDSLISERVGSGLVRKLYSTYISYLPPAQFVYSIPSYEDERGVFSEVLKTKDSGQFSFFTAKQGVTRGGHYHHSKTEKFLVIKGIAKFGFRNIFSDETYEVNTSGDKLEIVETVPGWAHDITNVGTEEIIVMLWANEVFDRDNPDTVSYEL